VLGIEHIHSLGFIARSILPENILMDEFGHIVLGNLANSKELSTTQEPTDAICFIQCEYRPPEVLRDEIQTKAVDWWTIGVLVYELTVGITPFFSGDVDEIFHKICNSKIRYPPRISEPCKDIISKLLNRTASERLGSGTLGVEEIKSHAWFQGIDWNRVSHRQNDPIFKPEVGTSPDDISAFQEGITNEPITDAVDTVTQGGSSWTPSELDVFHGFEFGASVGEAEE
jgi:serine/threonine protein kinase